MQIYRKPRGIAGCSGVRSAVIGDQPIAFVSVGGHESRTQRYAERHRRFPTPAEKQLARIFREVYQGVEWNRPSAHSRAFGGSSTDSSPRSLRNFGEAPDQSAS
jgi:hypothetical protein